MKSRFKITMVFEGDLDMAPGWGYTPQSWIDLAKVSFERQSHYHTSAYVQDIQIDGMPAAAHEDAYDVRRRNPHMHEPYRARVEIESIGYDGVVFNMDDAPHQEYHFYWWNWLPHDLRYFGYRQGWHDGPMSSFGFWFFNWGWRMPWTKHDGGLKFF